MIVYSRLADLALAATLTQALAGRVERIARWYATTLRRGGTLLFCGNGGSAADAQHLATEYVVRFRTDRRPYAALALTTDTSLLTAAGNDLGFDRIFARQVEALARPGDLLILHTTSGRSPNLLRAAETARAKGVGAVAFLGRDAGPLTLLVDEAVHVPAEQAADVQVVQLALEHAIVEVVETLMSQEEAA